MAELLYTYINPTSKRDLAKTCAVLESGGVIAYPTDVNWGLGCDAASVKALNKLRTIKPTHPKSQPFSLLCSSLNMVAEYGMIESHHYRLLRKALPGPYTFLLQRGRNLPKQIKDKRPVVGIRIPDSPLLIDLIEAFQRPLVNTSMGWDDWTPDFGYQVEEKLGYTLDLILDLGEKSLQQETTVIDLSSGVPEVLRLGLGDPSLIEG